jgi:uncharacterized membrane protein YecN with MAPEG domain
MSLNPVPISTLFIGLNGFLAFVLSYIVVKERTSTRANTNDLSCLPVKATYFDSSDMLNTK